ncbi:DUF5753 domain-containing protein [Streptomyces sp. NPDC004959]|uniref:DUF5753 domain-containing protein n=1 Tax=unclassified Streptomyces TaxID=2593676 RepID=UPI00068A9519|nr:DUF5753 domain-containing protein [Streptomyces sp. NRRL F-5630]
MIALCENYAAPREKRALLLEYAAVTKSKRDWWQTPEFRLAIPPSFKAYLGLEATAESLNNYKAEFVPGLLQTEGYVWTIHERSHERLPSDEIDRIVAVRMTRQEALHRVEAPLQFAAIINEAVLYRQVGGPDVMRAQVQHLCEMAMQPGVRIQVVPFKAGAHAGVNGSFMLLRFEDAQPIVYLENLGGASVMRKPKSVDQYERAFTDLQILALGERDSLGMMKEAIKEH